MKTISVIKLIPFSVVNKNGALTVYGKIYSYNKSIFWDVNYHCRRTSTSSYYNLPIKCESVEEAEKALEVYIKEFSEDYVYNSKF